MGCYYTLCHNTYAYSLLFYKDYTKRKNASSWNSGLEKEQILETYSAQLQKSWNFPEIFFQIYKKYWEKELHQGATPFPQGWGARPTPQGAPPTSWAPWWPSGGHLLLYGVFRWEKIHKPSSQTKLRRHEAEPWRNNVGLWRSCSAGETSLPVGEIIVITNAPLIGRGQSPSTSSSAPSPLKTLVHLLYPILVSKSGIGASRLLVVLITPCSWC